ncbi:flagellar hook-length control protein FliK [Legionella feeleii]|uniref:Flagellar hook-length control protein FliK n=1 Tax=Legionella feeleii TaxID=453 RepID=A0A378IWS3_9GAMM|nr:flagellar hook-length control protein FliK [Legionella feeleii]STX39589.1 Flagellar hook-length control protein FliK [Legionella feeleii]
MPVDIGYTPSIRLNPIQELKITKPDIELYAGQILKTVVVKELNENQVLININGQNINANTAHHFDAGELLQVKVVLANDETILQVLHEPPPLTPIQTALLQALPKQASATHLLASLTALENMPNLPAAVQQQLHQLIDSITPLSRLPQHFAQAIRQSGLFWEATLLASQQNNVTQSLNNDFKGQCLRLLAVLLNEGITPANAAPDPVVQQYSQDDTLPLPGAIPHPPQRLPLPNFNDHTINSILGVLLEQTEQVLARIKTSQLTHLLHSPDQPYSLMLELPLRVDADLELLPLLIKEHRQSAATAESSWSVTFAINLAHLGSLQARLRLQDRLLDIQINAEKPDTVDLLATHQQTVAELLAALDLDLGLWCLHLGLEKDDIDTSNLRLLDLRV